MPIWFIAWPELAAHTGKLTAEKLEAFRSRLKGEAPFFSETLHPSLPWRQAMISIVAYGTIEDGRAFTYHATEVNGVRRAMRIEFR